MYNLRSIFTLTNNYINLINLFASNGFGFNTDIFETNILNLSVVIGVLIYYGRAICIVTNTKLKEIFVHIRKKKFFIYQFLRFVLIILNFS
jgi:F-type H+-transporting ATPase subunit b